MSRYGTGTEGDTPGGEYERDAALAVSHNYEGRSETLGSYAAMQQPQGGRSDGVDYERGHLRM